EWDPPRRWGLSLGKESLTKLPQRVFPQRHVAGESPDMSPGKQAIVVVQGPIIKKAYYLEQAPCNVREGFGKQWDVI
ncbi:hypothetical protein Tco_1453183, partial [Tanacetum coccineum]